MSALKATAPDCPNNGQYGVKEASSILGCSRSSLRNFCNHGLIKFEISERTNRKIFKGAELKRFWRKYY